MAAGDPFTLVPNVVTPLVPKYNTVETESESQKKEYYNITATPIETFKVDFKAISNADRELLLAHYKDQSGGYYPFSWTSVPSYISSGANMTGRWVKDSLKMDPVSNMWKCSITFEKAN